MRYVSTRGRAPELAFDDVLLEGLATDGGLYVPAGWPLLPEPTELDTARSYADAAHRIITPFVGDSLPADDLRRMCDDAYATFDHPAVVPLVQLDHGRWLAELFHGPTLAFKDLALQLVGRLFDYVLERRGARITIVGATSGDTGSAAIEAVRDCRHIDAVILYPHGGTSEVQRRQMTTVDAPNICAVAVEGTFDDCQDLVKAMFADTAFREQMRLAAVNSINWARIMAQVVYHVTAVRSLAGPVTCLRADRQLRQRVRRMGGPPDGNADRRLPHRHECQRHHRPVRRPRRHVGLRGGADPEPEHGHPGVVELRAHALGHQRWQRRADRRADAAVPPDRAARRR